jgi:hypothetical protein
MVVIERFVWNARMTINKTEHIVAEVWLTSCQIVKAQLIAWSLPDLAKVADQVDIMSFAKFGLWLGG